MVGVYKAKHFTDTDGCFCDVVFVVFISRDWSLSFVIGFNKHYGNLPMQYTKKI